MYSFSLTFICTTYPLPHYFHLFNLPTLRLIPNHCCCCLSLMPKFSSFFSFLSAAFIFFFAFVVIVVNGKSFSPIIFRIIFAIFSFYILCDFCIMCWLLVRSSLLMVWMFSITRLLTRNETKSNQKKNSRTEWKKNENYLYCEIIIFRSVVTRFLIFLSDLHFGSV